MTAPQHVNDSLRPGEIDLDENDRTLDDQEIGVVFAVQLYCRARGLKVPGVGAILDGLKRFTMGGR